jgi:hypothetical protein
MNRSRPQWVTSATMRLGRFRTNARRFRSIWCSQAKVVLQSAVLQLLGHPGLNMRMQFTSIDTTLFAFLLSDKLPSGLELVGADSAGVKRHLGSVNGAVDDVKVG